jgi:hypothetical protein
VKILKTNVLALALVALNASASVGTASYAQSAWDYVKATRAASAVSFVAGKAKSAASFAADKAKAGMAVASTKAVTLARAAKTNATAAGIWTLTKHSNLCDRVNGGINWASRGVYGKLTAERPRLAKAVATGVIAGTVYAGYKGAQWAYNKAKAMIAARKAQETKATVVTTEVAAPVVAVKVVRFADLNAAQKASVQNLAIYRAGVNAEIKRGNYRGQKPYANITVDAVAQELFGKAAIAA